MRESLEQQTPTNQNNEVRSDATVTYSGTAAVYIRGSGFTDGKSCLVSAMESIKDVVQLITQYGEVYIYLSKL